MRTEPEDAGKDGPSRWPVAPGEATCAAVEYSRRPTGVSLPEPTEQARSRATLAAYRAADPSAKSGAGESPYGCYLASRPYSEAVAFRSVYLYFPEAVIERAGSETRRFTFQLRASRAGSADTSHVRYAHCVAPKIKDAQTALVEQVLRKGELSALREAVQSTESGPNPKACKIEATSCRCFPIGGPTMEGPPGPEKCYCNDFNRGCSTIETPPDDGSDSGDGTGDGGTSPF
jgi:hypothetical protein